MWIHIPSNETAWEMPKTGKNRLRKQGKPSGTYACRYRSRSYNFERRKRQGTYDQKNAQSSTGNPRFDRTRSNMNVARILQKHSPTKSHVRDKTDKKHISRDFLAGDRWQQLFEQPTFVTTLGSPVLRVRLCLAFSLRPASTNGIVLPSILLWITLVANTSARFALAKEQELVRFFIRRHGIDINS